mmetsp:Transcript_31382/g.80083  ORF Transcript_31382/g.80083 Transcript_31382/m.80083 type:complete len:263 (-) Transcript_31382:525-1313(-)
MYAAVQLPLVSNDIPVVCLLGCSQSWGKAGAVLGGKSCYKHSTSCVPHQHPCHVAARVGIAARPPVYHQAGMTGWHIYPTTPHTTHQHRSCCTKKTTPRVQPNAELQPPHQPQESHRTAAQPPSVIARKVQSSVEKICAICWPRGTRAGSQPRRCFRRCSVYECSASRQHIICCCLAVNSSNQWHLRCTHGPAPVSRAAARGRANSRIGRNGAGSGQGEQPAASWLGLRGPCASYVQSHIMSQPSIVQPKPGPCGRYASHQL